jgi:hypothetical protein
LEISRGLQSQTGSWRAPRPALPKPPGPGPLPNVKSAYPRKMPSARSFRQTNPRARPVRAHITFLAVGERARLGRRFPRPRGKQTAWLLHLAHADAGGEAPPAAPEELAQRVACTRSGGMLGALPNRQIFEMRPRFSSLSFNLARGWRQSKLPKHTGPMLAP